MKAMIPFPPNLLGHYCTRSNRHRKTGCLPQSQNRLKQRHMTYPWKLLGHHCTRSNRNRKTGCLPQSQNRLKQRHPTHKLDPWMKSIQCPLNPKFSFHPLPPRTPLGGRDSTPVRWCPLRTCSTPRSVCKAKIESFRYGVVVLGALPAGSGGALYGGIGRQRR